MLMQSQQTPEQQTGELVRHHRIAHGLSQQELAAAMTSLGLSWHQTTVAKTEAAERPIRVNELVALARVLDVPASTLVEESRGHAGGRQLVELLRAKNRLSETQKAAERTAEAYEAAKERFVTVQAAYTAAESGGEVVTVEGGDDGRSAQG